MSIRAQLRDINEKVEIYLSVERYHVAEKLIQEALRDLGDLANLHNLMGICYHRQSKFNEAITSFKRAIEINPKFVEACLNLSISYCDLGLYEQAETFYSQASDSIEDEESRLSSLLVGRLANMHADTAKAYEKVGLWAEAIKEFEKALSLFPNMPDIQMKLAKLELKQGRRDKAYNHLLHLNHSFAPNPMVENLLGVIAYQEHNLNEAKNRWKKAQEISPEDRLSKSYLRCIEHFEFAKNP